MSGLVLLILALVPGLMDDIENGLRRFEAALLYRMPLRAHRYSRRAKPPKALAAIGVAFVVLAFAAYFAR